jgi:hypothetical protein
MALIGATTLADLRTRAEAMLGDTCTITRPGSPTTDAVGGETTTFATVASGVACLLRPAGAGDERVVGGGTTAVATWVVRLPAGTDVRAADRITTTVGAETRTLEVLPPVGGSSYELLRTVGCSEIA